MTDDAPLSAALALLDLDLPPQCVPGVRANLELLREHLRVLQAEADAE